MAYAGQINASAGHICPAGPTLNETHIQLIPIENRFQCQCLNHHQQLQFQAEAQLVQQTETIFNIQVSLAIRGGYVPDPGNSQTWILCRN